jgi:hypothetical protein
MGLCLSVSCCWMASSTLQHAHLLPETTLWEFCLEKGTWEGALEVPTPNHIEAKPGASNPYSPASTTSHCSHWSHWTLLKDQQSQEPSP